LLTAGARADDPLPSWNDGPVKQSIIAFVTDVTDPKSKSFVPPELRIATFDNDGTLWCEQPIYVQFAFAIDRVKQLAPQHPEWRTAQPFAGLLKGDLQAALTTGVRGIIELVTATHAGMTTADFERLVTDWLKTARHPRFHQPYTKCVYQPMLELLAYLRAHEFKTFVVSGGGIEFMRPWTEPVYGIPPEQVVGTSIKTKLEFQGDTPVLMRLPEMNFIDDGAGKPVGINSHIGRRPIAAFGNSDGDLQMLQWTAAHPGKTLCLIVHHTDAKREYAYDRKSDIGKLDKALDEAERRHWLVADMARDFKQIFPFDSDSSSAPAK
jgi:hypothetical protein